LLISIEIPFAFGQEMDGARRTKFAVDFRIPAFMAVFAHVDVMFHADITGLSVEVIGTGLQFPASSFFAKGFEFIADLSNWGQLEPSRDEFVNLFVMLGSLKNRPPNTEKVTTFQYVRHHCPVAEE
jgi:hypothetical protein